MARLIAALAATLLAACSAQQGAADESILEGRVRDLANILAPETEARLTARLDEAERLYGPQVAIVTVESLEGRPIEDYSLDYARNWGLGDKQRDDGLLILMAPNERKVRIEVGNGLEGSFSDVFCAEVIEKTMLPQFRQGHYGRGIESAVDMVIAKVRDVPTLQANDNARAATEKAA